MLELRRASALGPLGERWERLCITNKRCFVPLLGGGRPRQHRLHARVVVKLDAASYYGEGHVLPLADDPQLQFLRSLLRLALAPHESSG